MTKKAKTRQNPIPCRGFGGNLANLPFWQIYPSTRQNLCMEWRYFQPQTMGGGARRRPWSHQNDGSVVLCAAQHNTPLQLYRVQLEWQNWVEPEWGRYQLDPSDHARPRSTRSLWLDLTDQGLGTGIGPKLEHRTRSAYPRTKPKNLILDLTWTPLGADLGLPRPILD